MCEFGNTRIRRSGWGALLSLTEIYREFSPLQWRGRAGPVAGGVTSLFSIESFDIR